MKHICIGFIVTLPCTFQDSDRDSLLLDSVVRIYIMLRYSRLKHWIVGLQKIVSYNPIKHGLLLTDIQYKLQALCKHPVC